MKYFGDGTMYQKVKYTHNINSPIEVKDYIGPVEYVNEELEAVYHDDGRLMPDGYDANGNMKWKYEYYIKDHLGNNRVLFADKNDDGIILNGSGGSGDNIQIYHYYPFGMTMDVLGNSYAPGSPENLYQYNGKELFNDLGFNSYNYGARWYDPSIGRFSGVDPRAEKYLDLSPYNYVANNPIAHIDPRGDTILANFQGNVLAESAYYLWKNTDEGQKFHTKFDVGGKFGKSLIEIGSNTSLNSSGLTTYNVNGKDVSGTDGISKEDLKSIKNAGEGFNAKISIKHKYNANIALDLGSQLVDATETLEHESQHVDLVLEGLLKYRKKPSSGIQHEQMRSGPLYKDRYNMLKKLKPFWKREAKRINYTDEQYINRITNEYSR